MVADEVSRRDAPERRPRLVGRRRIVEPTWGRLVLTGRRLLFLPTDPSGVGVDAALGTAVEELELSALEERGGWQVELFSVTSAQLDDAALVIEYRDGGGVRTATFTGKGDVIPDGAAWLAQLDSLSVPVSHVEGIDPMADRGYAVAGNEWRRVFSMPAGAIRISSGARVQGPQADTEWFVWSPASRGPGITLFRMSESGRSVGGGKVEMTLRDFLARNPRRLVGQTVGHDGAVWRVAAGDGLMVRLEDDAGRTRDAPSTVVVDENIERFSSRVVVLVDVG